MQIGQLMAITAVQAKLMDQIRIISWIRIVKLEIHSIKKSLLRCLLKEQALSQGQERIVSKKDQKIPAMKKNKVGKGEQKEGLSHCSQNHKVVRFYAKKGWPRSPGFIMVIDINRAKRHHDKSLLVSGQTDTVVM